MRRPLKRALRPIVVKEVIRTAVCRNETSAEKGIETFCHYMDNLAATPG